MQQEQLEERRQRLEWREKELADLQARLANLLSEFPANDNAFDIPEIVESMDGKTAEAAQRSTPKRIAMIGIALALVTGALFPFERTVATKGRVVPEMRVYLKAAADGRLRSVNVTDGDWVNAGDVVAEFDNDYIITALENKTQELAHLGKKLEYGKQIIANRQDVWDRLKQQSNSVSIVEMATAEYDYYQSLSDQEAVKEDRAQLLSEIAAQAHDLSCSRVVAPFDGRVVTRDLPCKRNVYFKKGEHVCEIVDPASWIVEVSIPEKHFDDIELGQTASVRFPTEGKWVGGSVVAISGLSEREVQTVESDPVRAIRMGPKGVVISIRLKDRAPRLVYGMDARARVIIARKSLLASLWEKLHG
ncbi:MAG: HlyD family efflux transporter periplasmic adaptor subunit [bacterium]